MVFGKSLNTPNFNRFSIFLWYTRERKFDELIFIVVFK